MDLNNNDKKTEKTLTIITISLIVFEFICAIILLFFYSYPTPYTVNSIITLIVIILFLFANFAMIVLSIYICTYYKKNPLGIIVLCLSILFFICFFIFSVLCFACNQCEIGCNNCYDSCQDAASSINY